MTSAMIGNLVGRLSLDTAEFTAGLAGARQSLSGFSSALKTFAATAALSTLGALGVAALKQAAQIGDLAETIGVTAEQIQVYNRMAIASGSSAESMAKGLQTIAEQAIDANSALSKLFKANGLDAKAMSVNEQIRSFMELLKNARTPAEQLSIAVGVLGTRVGRDLVEAFRGGAKSYDDMNTDMIASGERMSNAEVKRLQDLETKYNEACDRIAAYWRKVVIGAVDGIQTVWEKSTAPNAVSEGRAAYFQRRGTTFGPGNGVQFRGNSGMGTYGGPNEYAGAPIPVVVTKLPPEDPTKVAKIKPDPLWKGTSMGVSENPMQEGAITGYDIRGYGIEVDQLTDAFGEAQDASAALAQSITETLGDAISGLASGAMSFKDAWHSMAQSLIGDLSDITGQLLKSGLLKLLSSFGPQLFGAQGLGGTGFGGFYAEGGHLGAGKWGIAGENGLEVVEGPATIRPMTAGGSTTVNIINQGGGQVDQRTRRGPKGDIVDVYVRNVAREEQVRGSKKLLGGGFGLTPALTQR